MNLYKIRLVPVEVNEIDGVRMADLFVFGDSIEEAIKKFRRKSRTFQHEDSWRVSWWCVWPTDPEGMKWDMEEGKTKGEK
jgi:hypothetical protein